MPRLRFAGQITGCEGYVESAAVGLIVGRYAAAGVTHLIFMLMPPLDEDVDRQLRAFAEEVAPVARAQVR